MRRSLPHRLTRPSLAWLVWLALLLPVAQYASVLHGLSHAVQPLGEDRQSPHYAHCELCVTAAEIAAGALPSVAATLLLPPARHVAPVTAALGAHAARVALPYRSRAPPFTSR